MPVRKSYMFCEALDMTFFFTRNGIATYTYAGYADSYKDSGKSLIEAFAKADKVRKAMEDAIHDIVKESD